MSIPLDRLTTVLADRYRVERELGLERLLAQRNRDLPSIVGDTAFFPLAQEPRFQTILRALGAAP